MKLYLSISALAGVLMLWLASGTEDQVNAYELKHYCKMVQTYNDTDGAYGWPDYDKEKECGE